LLNFLYVQHKGFTNAFEFREMQAVLLRFYLTPAN
jgi:hypothetical protein